MGRTSDLSEVGTRKKRCRTDGHQWNRWVAVAAKPRKKWRTCAVCGKRQYRHTSAVGAAGLGGVTTRQMTPDEMASFGRSPP